MAFLNIKKINKSFGRVVACKNIDLQAEKGEIIVVAGESGSGKSTLLKILAGFEKQDNGQIILDNIVLNDGITFVKPNKRNISLVFQDYSLFPHFTIKKNIQYALKNKNEYKHYLSLLKLNHLKERLPNEISGGQRQRVALIRAIASKPKLILMDEPFSSLDRLTKEETRKSFKETLNKLSMTAIIVSHDIEDAYALADKMFILKEGEIIDSGKVEDIYKNPKSEYSAALLGEINIIEKANYSIFGIKSDSNRIIVRAEDVSFQEDGPAKAINSVFKSGKYLSEFKINNISIKSFNYNNIIINNCYKLTINKIISF